MLSDQATHQGSTNGNEAIYKKLYNKLISIFEKEFNLESQPRMLIGFESQYDIWYGVPKGFDRSKFTTDGLINSVENELGAKFKNSFQIKMRGIEDLWIPINAEILKDTLDEDEYKSVINDLMMIRCSFVSGKTNRESELGELICVTIIFSSGHIRS